MPKDGVVVIQYYCTWKFVVQVLWNIMQGVGANCNVLLRLTENFA